MAKAMVVDAEAFLSNADRKEMSERIGWPGLKRLYYDEIMQLAGTLVRHHK